MNYRLLTELCYFERKSISNKKKKSFIYMQIVKVIKGLLKLETDFKKLEGIDGELKEREIKI